jgi:hypothetical protein
MPIKADPSVAANSLIESTDDVSILDELVY